MQARQSPDQAPARLSTNGDVEAISPHLIADADPPSRPTLSDRSETRDSRRAIGAELSHELAGYAASGRAGHHRRA
jgi:hypothetical protein